MSVESLVFDDTSVIGSKLISLAMENQKVIANNIANSNTPGYVKLKLDFQNRLTDAVNSGDSAAVSGVQPNVVEDTSNAPGSDGNNVVLAQELNDMMQNSVFHNLMARAFKTRMTILKSAIR